MGRATSNRRAFIGAGLAGVVLVACGRSEAAQLARDVRDFGAQGDGVSDDAPAIQRAIDAVARAGGGMVALTPGTYLLRYRPAEDGDGVSALTLRSGVTIEGSDRADCILKLAGNQMGPGTYARLIASRGEIARAALRRFTIDGNRAGQFGSRENLSGAAILLGWKGRCVDVTVEMMNLRDVVGQGIMLQGSIGNVSRNVRIADNLVERTSYIGIQSSQFDGVEIVRNRVFDCRDNGIDIYGDDTATHSTRPTSRNARIANNEIRGCSIGIFLETVADSVAEDNVVVDCRTAGVRINRIHGEPRNLVVARNRISGTLAGIAMAGDTGGVVIRDNVVRSFSRAGIDFGYNVSRVTITGNHFIPATRTTPIVLGTPTAAETPPQKLVGIHVRDNHVPRGHSTAHLFCNKYHSLIDVQIDRFLRDLD